MGVEGGNKNYSFQFYLCLYVFDLPDSSNAAFGENIKSLYKICVYERVKVSLQKV